MSDRTLYLDATMLYRWRNLAPVGIVRLERLLASHLRFRSELGPAQYLLWDSGYRPAASNEATLLDELLIDAEATSSTHRDAAIGVGTPQDVVSRRGIKATVRRQSLKVVAQMPDHLRPFAEQAAWSVATLLVESARHLRRAREDRSTLVARRSNTAEVRHRLEFAAGDDLVALGLGWEYMDHQAMYQLKQDGGIRVHMPAFDLIPVLMPQLNVAQSDLVHRYYAEMAHYADTVTCISHSTSALLRRFYEHEQLPIPVIETNQLPSFKLRAAATPRDSAVRRHRLEGQQFVLTVSTVEIRKNHILLAKIWAECGRDGTELPRLAIVGRVGWDVTELMRWIEDAPELRERVSIYSDVDDAELDEMYRDALFTVFPSRVEGWGMPITESMAYGKACLHADDPAQHEASQGLMPYLHPDDFTGWRHEITRLATDDGYRASLEQLIRDSYVPRTVDEYCARYEEILAARRVGGT